MQSVIRASESRVTRQRSSTEAKRIRACHHHLAGVFCGGALIGVFVLMNVVLLPSFADQEGDGENPGRGWIGPLLEARIHNRIPSTPASASARPKGAGGGASAADSTGRRPPGPGPKGKRPGPSKSGPKPREKAPEKQSKSVGSDDAGKLLVPDLSEPVVDATADSLAEIARDIDTEMVSDTVADAGGSACTEAACPPNWVLKAGASEMLFCKDAAGCSPAEDGATCCEELLQVHLGPRRGSSAKVVGNDAVADTTESEAAAPEVPEAADENGRG